MDFEDRLSKVQGIGHIGWIYAYVCTPAVKRIFVPVPLPHSFLISSVPTGACFSEVSQRFLGNQAGGWWGLFFTSISCSCGRVFLAKL